MFTVSMLSNRRDDMRLVLPELEQQYQLLACLHSAKMEALYPRGLC